MASPGCDCAVMPVAIVEKFPVQGIPRHRNAPPPSMGAGLTQGGRSSLGKRISTEQNMMNPAAGNETFPRRVSDEKNNVGILLAPPYPGEALLRRILANTHHMSSFHQSGVENIGLCPVPLTSRNGGCGTGSPAGSSKNPQGGSISSSHRRRRARNRPTAR
jgi:hypothetical protein